MRGSGPGVLRCNDLPLASLGGSPPVHVRRLLTVLPSVLALLVSCGGDSGKNGGSATISGKVVDAYGLPLASRTVLIGASSTTTDANGSFTLTGVAIPYDLVVLAPAPDKFASVFVQLTRTDPKVPDLSAGDPPVRSATVKGAITGGAPFPTPAQTETVITWGSADQAFGGVSASSSSYSLDVAWVGPTSVSGNVHGLQFSLDDNLTVTGYVSHGVKSGVSLSDTATVTGADLVLTAPQTDTISVTATLPAGHEIFQRNVILGFDDGAFIQVSGDGLDAGTLDVPVPSDIGATSLVQFRALSTDGAMETDAQLKGVTPGTSGAALTLPAPARLTSPANGATGVGTGTELVWTPVGTAIHVMYLSGTANDPTYGIVSAGSRAPIPDLSGHGLVLPSGHSYDVTLLAFGSFASLDAFAATGTLPKEGSDFQTVSFSGFTTR